MIAIIAGIAIVLFAVILLLEKVRENQAMKLNENLTCKELVSMSNKSALRPLVVLAALFLIAAIVVICVPVKVMTFAGVSLITSLAVAVYTYILITTNTYAYLLDLKRTSEKARLSKNNTNNK